MGPFSSARGPGQKKTRELRSASSFSKLKYCQMSGLEAVLDDERRAIERSEIGKLPERMRQCLQLSVDQGLQYKDIATTLGITEGTVKGYVAEARTRLRDRCSERLGD